MELTRTAISRSVQFPRITWKWLPMALLTAVLVAVLAYPLVLLFIKSFAVSRPGQPVVWGWDGWIAAFTDINLAVAIGNTFYLALVRVAISSALAIFFAWVVTRTDTPLKGFIEVALWLGFFLPLLPMTMGWILLLDPYYGLINKFLTSAFGLSTPLFDVYSYWGIIWCHLAFSTSVRFLLMTPAFTAMDAALEDAARASGSNNLGVLMRITIPILAPAILASTALGFIRSLESLEIEMVLGIPAGIYVVPTNFGITSIGNRRSMIALRPSAASFCCSSFSSSGCTGSISAAGSSRPLPGAAIWSALFPWDVGAGQPRLFACCLSSS